MSGNELTNTLRVKTTYTFDEAVEYMKMKDKEPTNIKKTIRWINTTTNKQTIIGYNT